MGLEEKLSKDGFVTSKIDELIKWSRKNALWPMPMGISCCAIEMMAAAGPRFDISRFGSEVFRFSPRQSDVMIVAGTTTYKMAQGIDLFLPVDVYVAGCPPRPDNLLKALMMLQDKISKGEEASFSIN